MNVTRDEMMADERRGDLNVLIILIQRLTGSIIVNPRIIKSRAGKRK